VSGGEIFAASSLLANQHLRADHQTGLTASIRIKQVRYRPKIRNALTGGEYKSPSYPTGAHSYAYEDVPPND